MNFFALTTRQILCCKSTYAGNDANLIRNLENVMTDPLFFINSANFGFVCDQFGVDETMLNFLRKIIEDPSRAILSRLAK